MTKPTGLIVFKAIVDFYDFARFEYTDKGPSHLCNDTIMISPHPNGCPPIHTVLATAQSGGMLIDDNHARDK